MWHTQTGNAAPGRNRKRRCKKKLRAGYLAILYVRSPAAFFDDSIFSPPLLPKILTKPRTVCACQPVVAMISASVAPLARFIMVMTSAFLLPPASGLFCARARRGALAGDFFPFPLAVATGSTGCVPSEDRRAIACQMRVTAALRLVNFLTGFSSSNGATPEAVPSVD